MISDPASVLRDLIGREPMALGALPNERGIYVLHDHGGTIRYIGITKSSGFFDRIHNRHVTGSEGRSHKFSHAYNTGRMWRARWDACPDAYLAKRLRTEFIRRHCRATFVSLPEPLWAELPMLESEVQALAPESMLDWGGRDFSPLSEPTDFVDALLEELSLSHDQRAAVERQAALHAATLVQD